MTTKQEFFTMTGPLTASMESMGATSEQVEAMKANIGGFCGPLVLSASELAERLEILPPECGGGAAAAALRMLDPGTKLQVTSDGPLTLSGPSSEDRLRDIVFSYLNTRSESGLADWTAEELADDAVQYLPALDGQDPADLVPFVEEWLAVRKA
jgi:hypothetical protein